MLATEEEQDRPRIGISKIDMTRGARNRDPSVDTKLGVRLEPGPPLALTPLRSVGAGLNAPVREPAVDDHLHRRIFPEDLVQ